MQDVMKLDDLAAFLAVAETSRKRDSGGRGVTIGEFSAANIFLDSADGATHRLYVNPRSSIDLHGEAGEFDVRILGNAYEDGIPRDSSALFSLQRFFRVRPSDVRGQTRCVLPMMCKINSAIVYKDGSWIASDGPIYGSVNGQAWRNISTVHTFQGDDSLRIRTAINIAAQRKLDWVVDLSFGHSAGIRVPTDPTGIRELFRTRDSSTRTGRRSALVHWVGEHYRQSRVDSDALIYVREHLRGVRRFQWNGMNCLITPVPDRIACVSCGDRNGPFAYAKALGPGGPVIVCLGCEGSRNDDDREHAP